MIITEGKARIRIQGNDRITRKMPVFYNPAMRLNRDVSVLLLKSIKESKLKIADPLAASGIRSIRFLTELNKSKVSNIFINDASKSAVANIKKNLKLNKVNNQKVTVANEEANLFLLKNRPFDYVDIDPFGTPVMFLDSAAKGLSRKAILAVTATDTAALSGTAKRACLRKYWAIPLKNHLMHELGLRILARRVQLAAASNGKALFPIYSYSMLHYMRIFFRCSYNTSDVDSILKNHRHVSYCNNCFSLEIAEKDRCIRCKSRKIEVTGPIWTGSLWDREMADAVCENSGNNSFLKTISDESKIGSLGFYDTHVLARRLKIQPPKIDAVISRLKKNGFKASRTHFRTSSIRTDAGLHFLRIFKAV